MPYIRALADHTDGVLSFIASSAGPKRDGLSIDQKRWILGPYRDGGGVFLWAHQYDKLPLGTLDVKVKDGALRATVRQWRDAEFPREVKAAYEAGILRAVSVGWDNISAADARRRGYDIPDKAAPDDVYHELLDISAVPVPGDPSALVERQRSALAALLHEMATDGVVTAPDVTPVTSDVPEPESPENAAERVKSDHARPFGPDMEYEDFAACVAANQDKDDPEAYCAMLEEETGESESRTVDTGEPESVRDSWQEVAAAMVDVLSPESEDTDKVRRRRYNALLPAYRRLDKVAPEFMGGADLRALGPDEWAGLWLEGEVETRAGKQLSTRNTELVQRAYDLTGQAHEALGELLEAATPKAEPEAEVETNAKRNADDTDVPDTSELARWSRILGKR